MAAKVAMPATTAMGTMDRNMNNVYQPCCAASDKADIRHTVQNSTGFAFGVKFTRKVTIQLVADAAEAIDRPESRSCRITQKQAGCPE